MAVLVGEDLDLDVAGALDQLLQIDFAGAEGALGLAARAVAKAEGRVVGSENGAHTFASTAGGGLEHDGIANVGGDVEGFFGRGKRVDAARGAGHAGFVGGLAGIGFGAKGAHGGGGWADELDSGGSQAWAKSAFSERKP